MKINLICLIALVMLTTACDSVKEAPKEYYLVSVYDEATDEHYFVDQDGKKQLKSYPMIFTDTLRDHAIVFDGEGENGGFFRIDSKGNHIHEIYAFDNGPDYTVEGVYRIVKNGKIGYVDSLTAKVLIEPQFDCAWQFENGKAKVSKNCRVVPDGEHTAWISDDWYFVDKKGNRTE